MKYRSDIDGLRAVAVLPVVLFHANYLWIPGGFVGVDIFFVISGYLISSIISRELTQGRFTFKSFYLRRVRRIIPALLVVLLSTLLAGYFFLLPEEYAKLSQATIAAMAFVPNIYFFDTSSTYFGLDVATEPLLHTWSLGVEEQFYIFFPLLMLLIVRQSSRRLQAATIGLLLFASLAANLLLISYLGKFTFYMLPTRAWELLFGVVLGLGYIPAMSNLKLANVVAISGLGLIAGSMLLITESDPFPGINALYPVLGATLIIWANTGNNTAVARLLSLRPMTLIGLISYSLYLWHWPVAVYAMMIDDGPLSQAIIVGVSIILAALSYRFVESRYRRPNQPLSNRQLGAELGIATVVAALAVGLVIATGGLPHRVPESAFGIVEELDNYIPDPNYSCENFGEAVQDRQALLCQLGERTKEPEFVVWGDSHAIALTPALHRAALKTGTSGYSIQYGGCRPLLGVFRKNKQRCLHFNDRAIALIKANPSIKQIYLAGYWRLPLMTFGYDNSNFFIVDDQSVSSSPQENRKVFQRGLARTLAQLVGRQVFIVEDVPEVGASFGKSVSNSFIRQAWLGRPEHQALVYHKQYQAYDEYYKQALESIHQPFDVILTHSILCRGSECPLLIDKQLVYQDGDHISLYGAYLLSPLFEQWLQKIKAGSSTGNSD